MKQLMWSSDLSTVNHRTLMISTVGAADVVWRLRGPDSLTLREIVVIRVTPPVLALPPGNKGGAATASRVKAVLSALALQAEHFCWSTSDKGGEVCHASPFSCLIYILLWVFG
jgi:hypothetical protein